MPLTPNSYMYEKLPIIGSFSYMFGLRRGAARAAAGLVMLTLAGCGSTPMTEGPVPTVPETVVAQVPTLAPAPSPAPAPASPATASTPGTPSPTPAASPTPSTATTATAQAELDVEGLIALLDDDAGRAGPRGEDLLKELERVADRPDRQRIERAIERTREWVDDGDLDPEVAQAALAALEAELAGAPVDDDEDDDDD